MLQQLDRRGYNDCSGGHSDAVHNAAGHDEGEAYINNQGKCGQGRVDSQCNIPTQREGRMEDNTAPTERCESESVYIRTDIHCSLHSYNIIIVT